MKHTSSKRPYLLRLYVVGNSLRSTHAIENLRTVCEASRPGEIELEVVDLYQKPEMAAVEQIVAAPTLVRKRPLPERRLVGDLTDKARLLMLLDLSPAALKQ